MIKKGDKLQTPNGHISKVIRATENDVTTLNQDGIVCHIAMDWIGKMLENGKIFLIAMEA